MRALRLMVPLAAAAFLVAGCGGGSKSSSAPASGAKVFADSGCGTCHTLAAAGSTGTVGPNLDGLKPTEKQVVAQVKSGGGGMPSFSDRLSTKQIDEVAAFVSGSAGEQKSVTPVGFKPNGTTLSDC